MDHKQESLSLERLCCLFCLCLYFFLLSSLSRWYIIIFIFDLFTTFLLPHHNKGQGVEKWVEVTRSKNVTLIINVFTEFLALNVTAMFFPGFCHAESLRPQMVQVFFPITSRCQTNIKTFNIEVQHTGILPSKN